MFEFFVFFVIGLLVGSFLNVVIVRLKTLETILGRSFCRHCRKKIHWYDNIPLLSYVVLRGRCRECKEGISLQYPLVETGTAVLFGLCGVVFFVSGDPVSWIKTLLACVTVAVAVIVFVYDWKYMEIPMVSLWIGIIIALLAYVWIDWASTVTATRVLSLHLHSGMLAGFGAFLFFFLLAAVSQERWMGLGDAYIAFWMGLLLGWPSILAALIFAFSLGALVGILLMAFSGFRMKSKLPFGPFLVIGLISLLFINELFPDWYLFFLYGMR